MIVFKKIKELKLPKTHKLLKVDLYEVDLSGLKEYTVKDFLKKKRRKTFTIKKKLFDRELIENSSTKVVVALTPKNISEKRPFKWKILEKEDFLNRNKYKRKITIERPGFFERNYLFILYTQYSGKKDSIKRNLKEVLIRFLKKEKNSLG